MKIDKAFPPNFSVFCSQQQSDNVDSPCFFLTPSWFQPYLEEWSPKNYWGLATIVEQGGEYAAFLSEGIQHSRLGLKYKSIGFNEATDPLVQNLTVEFNGFLPLQSKSSGTSLAPPIFERCFSTFLKGICLNVSWDELRLSGLDTTDAKDAAAIAKRSGLISTVVNERLTYSVDLELIRNRFNSDYISSRSSNTRAQLRKSKRAIENTLGLIRIESAPSLECAQSWLTDLGVLHANQWNTSAAIEGFNNPRFVDFHRKALTRMWPEGKAYILRISAGNAHLAYLHYFVVDRRAYFNMSGINYKERGAAQPGLIAHWLAIDFFMQKQLKIYDFMAGTYRYKESLSTHSFAQKHILIRRRRWFFILEDVLRNLKLGVYKRIV